MSFKHHQDHADGNRKEIIDKLRSHGVEVVEIDRPVDVLCRGRDGFVCLVELKTKTAQYTRKQLTFLSQTRMPVAIAHNAADAFEFLRTHIGLSQRQRDSLAAFLLTAKGDKWSPAQIRRVLAK